MQLHQKSLHLNERSWQCTPKNIFCEVIIFQSGKSKPSHTLPFINFMYCTSSLNIFLLLFNLPSRNTNFLVRVCKVLIKNTIEMPFSNLTIYAGHEPSTATLNTHKNQVAHCCRHLHLYVLRYRSHHCHWAQGFASASALPPEVTVGGNKSFKAGFLYGWSEPCPLSKIKKI